MLIICLVKSLRACTEESWLPSDDETERIEDSASLITSSLPSSVVSLSKFWAVTASTFRKVLSIEVALPFLSLAWTLMKLVPVSFSVSFRLSPRSRLTPLKEASSPNLVSWSRRSLNCLASEVRTLLPATVPVEVEPSTLPLVTPVVVRSWVDRFWMRSLPLSFDAVTLPMRPAVALIAVTIWSTVRGWAGVATTPLVDARFAAAKPIALRVVSSPPSVTLAPLVLVNVSTPPDSATEIPAAPPEAPPNAVLILVAT